MEQYIEIEKGLVGLMLPHQQFRLPDLVEIGAAASAAGFRLLWASDHCSRASRTRVIRDGRGLRCPPSVAREWRLDRNHRQRPDAAL